MLRSFVARSQPLLSRLKWPATTPVDAKLRILPSRAYASSATSAARRNGSANERTSMAAQHLYVVLREKENEMSRFSIYKLPDVDEDAVTDDQAPRCLPRAALSLGVPLVGSSPHFEALGSKISIYGYASVIAKRPCIGHFLTLLYDTRTGTLDGGRPLPDLPHLDEEVEIKDGYHAATPVDGGNKLCVLEAEENKPFYLYKKKDRRYGREWTWEQGPSPLPLDATGDNISVKSHAVHPDGYTIFASSSFTFSLDTESGASARRGSWLLPFHGRGYYDGDLDAWIGIRLADGTEGGSIKGCPYLCACNVPTALGRQPNWHSTTFRKPAWKMCKQELTFVKAVACARSPTLLHTGHGKFCLLEISPPTSDGVERLLHVTMFHAKHGKNGELEIMPCEPGRSYLVPNYYSKGFYTAMWM